MEVVYHKTLHFLEHIHFDRNDVLYLYILWGNDIRHPKTSSAVTSFLCVNWEIIHVFNHLHDEYHKIDSKSFFTVFETKSQYVSKKFIYRLKNVLHLHEEFKGKRYNDLEIFKFNKSGVEASVEKNFSLFSKEKNSSGLNILIPLSKHVQYFSEYIQKIKGFSEFGELYEPGYRSLVDRIVPFLYSVEKNGVHCDIPVFEKYFGHEKTKFLKDSKIYTDYNIFSLTGRPSNSIHNVNFSALNKDNGERAFIKSRYGKDGMLVLYDFKAYHPHLLAKLMNFKFPKFSDFYTWMTDQMKDVSDSSSSNLKSEVFIQFYGKIDKKYLGIPYYKKLDEFIKSRSDFYYQNGYIDTPIFNRSISNISDPFPNKIVNYMLQAYETEKNCLVMETLNQCLYNKLTVPILYCYDSFLFDAHKQDGIETLKEIKNIMVDGGFPVSTKAGKDFHNMTDIKI